MTAQGSKVVAMRHYQLHIMQLVSHAHKLHIVISSASVPSRAPLKREVGLECKVKFCTKYLVSVRDLVFPCTYNPSFQNL